MGLDYLVPDKQIMREFSISAMTLYRWSHNKEMNFPVAIQINGRNFRSRLQTGLSRNVFSTKRCGRGPTRNFSGGQGHKGAALLRPDDGSSKLMADSHDELRRAAKVAGGNAAAFGTA